MRSYTGWCGSADYLINDVSQSSQSFGCHDNARSYNSAHGWWLLPCHQIADIIPGVDGPPHRLYGQRRPKLPQMKS
jgi:hypothetical protein